MLPASLSVGYHSHSLDYQQLSQRLPYLAPISLSAAEISPQIYATSFKDCVLPVLQDLEKLPEQMPFEKMNILRDICRTSSSKSTSGLNSTRTWRRAIAPYAYGQSRTIAYDPLRMVIHKAPQSGSRQMMVRGGEAGIKKGKSSLDRHMGENQSDHQKAWSAYQMELNKLVIDDRFDRIKRGILCSIGQVSKQYLLCYDVCNTRTSPTWAQGRKRDL